METTIQKALQDFAEAVTAKMTQLTPGEPEDQLRGPFENFMAAAAGVLKWKVVCTGETPLADHLGRPDYAVHLGGLLSGYAELKAPGMGADTSRYVGHNRNQWNRFKAIPNMLYTDGNEWGLYRSGELVDHIVHTSGNVAAKGKRVVSAEDAAAIERILRDFFSWEPIIPKDHDGNIDLKRFAVLLAPLCRMLRDDVTDALKNPASPIVQIAKDWRQLLFPNASDETFADAYAQTVTFALLLGRSESSDALTIETAVAALASQHNLLSRALEVLTDPRARGEMTASLNLLLRVVAATPSATMGGSNDPWLYFYEDFLAAYDPKLRKDAGAYYTPVEVVHAQVRLIDDLLVNRLGKAMGFADPGVVTLDPATGTGTYLLGVIERALSRIEKEQGPGAVPGQAVALAKNLYGLEIMVGPYAVTELRTSRALRDRGVALPQGDTHILLTDTLENPHAEVPELPFYFKPLSEQHARALKVKSDVPVMVCLGNPPYDRHEAAADDNHARTGGWVRWGDESKALKDRHPILEAFLGPAKKAGHGVDLKNLYNLYVYFWRWALWKVFEQNTGHGPGVVSFITDSSYLDGGAFCGMRQVMREECDDIWILDLGGEGRGTHKNQNVFAIQTPVAIAVAMRIGHKEEDSPAAVHYARIEGTREAKLQALDSIDAFSSVKWRDCSSDWQSPFRPSGTGTYFGWPLATDLMPWQHSGAGLKRTWPICHDPDVLKIRWQALLSGADRAALFRESRDRKIESRVPPLVGGSVAATPIAQLPSDTPAPPIEPYAYRSFDRQWVFADSRLGDYLRPTLWATLNKRQVFLATSIASGIGRGPALTSSFCIPDLNYFSGRGGKDIIPFYVNNEATQPNVLPGLLDLLRNRYQGDVTPEAFLAYIYGVLAQPGFTARYAKELESHQLRVPITTDPELFQKVSDLGAQLLWLHTYGERFVPKGKHHGQVPAGTAKCTKPVPGDPAGYPEEFAYDPATRTLRVGDGEFCPVASQVFEFEVSSLKVVQSWLKYRMRKGAGKKSSPLDDIRPDHWTNQFTTELLELLWVLEATLEVYPEQARLLESIVAGACFNENELPRVPDEARKPPVVKDGNGGGLFGDGTR
ncbi:MAG TPA: type ISP restriction/modification enzyme [Candidatus Cryosericum sp.]